MAAQQHTDPSRPDHPDRPTMRLRRPIGPHPRLDLVQHLREEIARDPEGFASRRLPYVVDRIVEDVREEGMGEPFCACGRRWSDCDGTRRACHKAGV